MSAAGITALLVILLATIAGRLADRGRQLEEVRRTASEQAGTVAALRADLEVARTQREQQMRNLEALAAEVRRLGGNPVVVMAEGPPGRPGSSGASGSPGGSTVVVTPPSSTTQPSNPPATTTTSTTTTSTMQASPPTTACIAAVRSTCVVP